MLQIVLINFFCTKFWLLGITIYELFLCAQMTVINFDSLSLFVCKNDILWFTGKSWKGGFRTNSINFFLLCRRCIQNTFIAQHAFSNIEHHLFFNTEKLSFTLLPPSLPPPFPFAAVFFCIILQIQWLLFPISQHHFNTSTHFLVSFVSLDSLTNLNCGP